MTSRKNRILDARLAVDLAVVEERAAAARAQRRPSGAVPIAIIGKIGKEVDGEAVVKQIRAARGKPLVVIIDSAGGHALDGIAIHDALAAHDAQVETRARLAQSAAALIFLAGRERNIEAGGELLLHEVFVKTGSNLHRGAVHSLAAVMEKAHRRCVEIVARAANVTTARAEFWVDGEGRSFSAEQAVTAGLAHAIVAPAPANAVRRAARTSASRAASPAMAAATIKTRRLVASPEFRWAADQDRRAARLKIGGRKW